MCAGKKKKCVWDKKDPDRFQRLIICSYVSLCQLIDVIMIQRYHINSIDLIHKSYNAAVPYPTMLQSEQRCTHFCSECSVVGFGTGAFWDLWNCSIATLFWCNYGITFLLTQSLLGESITNFELNSGDWWWDISYWIAFRLFSLYITDDKSTSVQVIW